MNALRPKRQQLHLSDNGSKGYQEVGLVDPTKPRNNTGVYAELPREPREDWHWAPWKGKHRPERGAMKESLRRDCPDPRLSCPVQPARVCSDSGQAVTLHHPERENRRSGPWGECWRGAVQQKGLGEATVLSESSQLNVEHFSEMTFPFLDPS